MPYDLIRWKPHIRMQNSAFLDIAAGTDMKAFIVAAQDRAKPDTCINFEFNLADDHGTGRYPVMPVFRGINLFGAE